MQQTLKNGAKLLVIALGILAVALPPNPTWIERAYVNGAYPAWEHFAVSVTAPLPWSLGDVAFLAGSVALVWRIVAFVRAPRRRRSMVNAALTCVAIVALYAVWFTLSWGWNYARAPLESRVSFDARRITPDAAVKLRARAIAQLNALAAAAHSRASVPLDTAALYSAWLPAVMRAGNDWTALVSLPKPTLADPFMVASGTSGFINPLTLNVALASDLLWFERPFDLAHEWSHDAAYAREDEANYLAILACLRSPDPAVQYSGWFELFLYLPQARHYARREFVPLVWRDFAALRERNARHINVLVAHWSWRTYNAYLKTNRVAAGIANYDQVTRLMLGVALDRRLLPLAR
ncbi:MAG: DUF3810 family protein [Candidatus Eremiobacteraeota bacterium]|nr:DUF3810 family protein [Candidatus Eremiobacteraeota bacterium]